MVGDRLGGLACWRDRAKTGRAVLNFFGGDKPRQGAARPGRLLFLSQNAAEDALIDWAYGRVALLVRFELCATAELAARLKSELALEPRALLPRADGGEMQAGAEIAAGKVQALFYFLAARAAPDEPDPAPLLRLAAARGAPIALTPASAELMTTSPMFSSDAAVGRRPTPTPERLADDAAARLSDAKDG